MHLDWLGPFLRGLGGVACLFWAWQLGIRRQSPDAMIDPGALLAGTLFFLAGMALLWQPLFRLALRPLFALADQIFSPSDRAGKPALNLKLPDHYLKEGRHEEALAEYLESIRHHPDAVEAYEKAIWLKASVFRDLSGAEKLLHKARRRKLTLDPAIENLVRLNRSTQEPFPK